MIDHADRGPSGQRTTLRRLYREVAKRVHPDLAAGEADRRRRELLMTDANRAFRLGDLDRLLALIEESEFRPDNSHDTTSTDFLGGAMRKLTVRVRLHLTFLDRYDGSAMKRSRAGLADDLLCLSPDRLIADDVPGFFEELHLFIHDGYVDESLAWTAFGFSTVRWWLACENYIGSERRRRKDSELFSGFQNLSARFSQHDVPAGFSAPGVSELICFLETERRLLTQAVHQTNECGGLRELQ
jgi:hypothetical protein